MDLDNLDNLDNLVIKREETTNNNTPRKLKIVSEDV